MTARRWVLALAVALLPLHAWAELDDLLTPLTPPKPQVKKEPAAKKRKVRNQPRSQPEESDLIAPLVAKKTELVVKVVGPADAQLQIDGEPARADKPIEVDPGEHEIKVRRPGFADYVRHVRAKPNKTNEVAAVLEPVAGVLTVTSDVPGSRVLLDGKSVGEAPVRGLVLAPGIHLVKLQREGFEDHESRIAVRAGRDYTVSGNLKPREGTTRSLMAVKGDRPEHTDLVPRSSYDELRELPLGTEPEVESVPLHQRWYVWAGAGAVVVAAVTSAVLMSRSSPADPLRPEDVCRGPCDGVLNGPAGLRFHAP